MKILCINLVTLLSYSPSRHRTSGRLFYSRLLLLAALIGSYFAFFA